MLLFAVALHWALLPDPSNPGCLGRKRPTRVERAPPLRRSNLINIFSAQSLTALSGSPAEPLESFMPGRADSTRAAWRRVPARRWGLAPWLRGPAHHCQCTLPPPAPGPGTSDERKPTKRRLRVRASSKSWCWLDSATLRPSSALRVLGRRDHAWRPRRRGQRPWALALGLPSGRLPDSGVPALAPCGITRESQCRRVRCRASIWS